MVKKYSPTQHIGFRAERIACQFLARQGLKPIASNYRNVFGEIDLIMAEHNTLVFIEVKYRKSEHYLKGIESISKAKQNKIIRTAQGYLQQFPTCKESRLDVVAIKGTARGYAIDWIKDAFQT